MHVIIDSQTQGFYSAGEGWGKSGVTNLVVVAVD